MKRVKEKEHRGRGIQEKFVTYGYIVSAKDGREYIYWGKLMADACEKAYKITGETNIYINEKLYVRPYNRVPGKQHIRPNWYFGRVYHFTRKYILGEALRKKIQNPLA